MADEIAKTSIVFDASGAKVGAEEVKVAADKIVAANEKVVAANDKAGESFQRATTRIAGITSAQISFLDRTAKAFNPFLAATEQAAQRVKNLQDIAEKGLIPGASAKTIEEAARATALLVEATQRLNTATANQAEGSNIAERFRQLTAAFAPAQASAQKMTAELASLNEALRLGVSIEGGYDAAMERIILKHDEGAQAALRAALAEKELAAQYRASAAAGREAFAADQAQNRFSSLMGIGGTAKSASESGSVFEAAFLEEKRLADQLAADNAKWDKVGTAAAKFKEEVASLVRQMEAGRPITGGYMAALDELAKKYGAVTTTAVAFAAAQEKVIAAVSAGRNNTLGGSVRDYGQQLADLDLTSSARTPGQVHNVRQADLESAFGDIEAQRSSLDALRRNSEAYAADLTKLNNVVNILNLSEDQEYVLLLQLNEAYGRTTGTAKALADEEARLAAELKAAGVATDEAKTKTAALADAEAKRLAQLLAKHDPIGTAQKAYVQSIGEIAELESKGLVSPAVAGTAAGAAGKRLDEIDGTAEATRKLAEENKRLMATYPSLLGAQLAHEKVISDTRLAVERGFMTQNEANQAVARSQATLDNYGKTLDAHGTAIKKVTDNSWAARFAAQQMGVQTVQFFSSVQAGQPIMTAFIGQAHQMVDIAISTGLGWGVVRESFAKFFAILATPMGASVAAFTLVAGTIAALSIHAETAARRVEALRNTLSLVNPGNVQALTEQSERVARSMSQTSSLGIDITEARAGTAALAAHSDALELNDEQAKNVMETYLKLARALGEPTKAWDLMTAGIASASKQSEQMEGKIAGVDRQLTNHLKELEEANKKGEAWNLWMRTIADSVGQVTNNMTELETSWKNLNNAMGIGSEKADSFAMKLGTSLNVKISGLVDLFTLLVKVMNTIPQDAVTKMVDSLLMAVPVIGSLNSLYNAALALRGMMGGGGGGGTGTITTPPLPGAAGTLPAGVVTITAARSGAKFDVSSAHAEAFQGLINELEARGYLIDPKDISSYRPGAVTASGKVSMHASADAIDINASRNRVGTRGDIPESLAQELSAKYGIPWGGNFRGAGRDPMHFGFDNVPGARSQLGTGTGTDPYGRMSDITKETIERAEELRKTYDATATTADTLKGKQQLLNDVIEKLGPSLKPEELERYKRAQAEIGGILENNRTPQEDMLHRMRLNLDLTRQLTEGDRRLFQERQQLATLNSEHAGTAEAERQQLELKIMQDERSRAELLKLQYENDRLITSNKEVAAGWGVSAKAAGEAAIRMRAYDDASKQTQLGTAAHSERVKELTDQYMRLGVSQEGVNTNKALHDLKQQADLTQALTEGERRRLALRQQMENAAPLGGVAPGAMTEAMAQENRKAEGELKQIEYALDREIIANDKAAEGWRKNAKAASEATIAMEAYTQASTKFQPGTALHTAAVGRLTDDLRERARSQQDDALSQRTSQNRDTLQYLAMENALLFENSDKRTIQLEQLKLEQDIKRNSPQASQPYIDSLKATGAAITENSLLLKNQQRDLQTVTGMFTGAFDTISNSITQALLTGQGAAINWRNVMTSVAQQILSAFLKLAIINPIMNNLFGQNNSTLGSVFNTLNKTPDTPGSTSSDGGSGGGIFGTIFKLGASISAMFGGAGVTEGSAGGGFGIEGVTAGEFSAPAGLVGTYHRGGLVGANDNFSRMYPVSLFANAPRFHNGLGGEEFAAILQKGERVLTARQQDQVAAATRTKGDGDNAGHVFNFNFPSNTTPDRFRASGSQVAVRVIDQLNLAKTRNS